MRTISSNIFIYQSLIRSLYDNIDKERLNKLMDNITNSSNSNNLLDNENKTSNSMQLEKEKKEFTEKLKGIREYLIKDLISRKKFIGSLSNKIEQEKECFFAFENQKIKNK